MAKQLDSRYKVLKVLVESDAIEHFYQIFQYIPKSVVYQDLGMNWTGFNKRIKDPLEFTLKDLQTIGINIGCDPIKIVHLALKAAQKKGRNKGT